MTLSAFRILLRLPILGKPLQSGCLKVFVADAIVLVSVFFYAYRCVGFGTGWRYGFLKSFLLAGMVLSFYYEKEPQAQSGFSLPGADRRPVVTWALLAINLVVWGATMLAGGSQNTDVLLRFGAMYGPFIATGDYWRLFTAMFLHIGIPHLLFNSFGLLVFGSLVERIYGPIRFVTIYILAGLAGSVASYSFNMLSIGAGASGAIFGVLGALAAFFFARRDMLGAMGRQNLLGLVIIAAFNLIFGFVTPGIDNWAHMGGLLGGVLIGLALAPYYRAVDVDALFGAPKIGLWTKRLSSI